MLVYIGIVEKTMERVWSLRSKVQGLFSVCCENHIWGGSQPNTDPKTISSVLWKAPKRHPLILGNPISDQDFGMDLLIVMLCEEKVEVLRAVLERDPEISPMEAPWSPHHLYISRPGI